MARGATTEPVVENDRTAALTLYVRDEGRAVPATVTVTAWPDSAKLQALPVGAAVPLQTIGSYTAGPDGAVFILVPPGARHVNGEPLNVDVTVSAAGKRTTWSTPINEVTPQALRANAAVHSTTRAVTLDLGKATVRDSDVALAREVETPLAQQVRHNAAASGQGRPAQPSESERAIADGKATGTLFVENEPAPSSLAGPPTAHSGPICQLEKTADLRLNLPEYWSPVYGWGGGSGEIRFSSGSTHNLGVGVGTASAMSQSGTAAITTGASATAKGIVDKWAVNAVNYRDYRNSCTFRITRRPDSIRAILPGGRFTYAKHYYFPKANCDPYNPGQSTTVKDDIQNKTYGAGVNIGPINVSAQAGWTRATAILFNFSRPSLVCGSDVKGWVQSPVVDARRR